MAPAVAAILAATSSAAAGSKRPADSDAEPPQAGAKGQQQPKQQQQLECPRCRSTNTKFCYYNNYSTAQPRHFCRACRRYWTHGGTLRDVPVGGASRRGGKRRRVSAEEPSSAASSAAAGLEEDACLPPDFAAFPFLSDGSFLPQLDLGVAPAAFSWPAAVPDFFDGLAPWDAGTAVGAAGVAGGAWGDFAGLDLGWLPPPGN